MRDANTEPRKRPGRWPPGVAMLNLAVVLALVAVVGVLAQRLRSSEEVLARSEEDRLVLGRQLAAGRAVVEAHRRETHERMDVLEQSSRQRVNRARDDGTRIASTESRRLVSELAEQEAEARETLVASLREELDALRGHLETEIEVRADDVGAFRRIREHSNPSVLLVHSAFTYRTRRDDGTMEEHTGKGWGTGFVITEEGHIATNKHVVQPWKFDAELCALEALGEAEILPESLILAAWPTGTRCLDDERRAWLEGGYNNQGLSNLRLAGIAEDRMAVKNLEIGSMRVSYEIHELDDSDLAILKAEGGTFVPLPCAPGIGPEAVLGQVMALGFPRGQNGLEHDTALSSPSLGTIRKVEDTIHITAPIIPGNSGGPVIGRDGRVIGIATRIYSETLGICLKIDHVLALLETVRAAEREAEREAESPPAATAVGPDSSGDVTKQ